MMHHDGGHDVVVVVCTIHHIIMSVIGHYFVHQIYIFRFRSYLVTDVGRILDAKGGCMNFS